MVSEQRGTMRLRTGGALPLDEMKLAEPGGRAYGIMMHELLSRCDHTLILTRLSVMYAIADCCHCHSVRFDGLTCTGRSSLREVSESGLTAHAP